MAQTIETNGIGLNISLLASGQDSDVIITADRNVKITGDNGEVELNGDTISVISKNGVIALDSASDMIVESVGKFEVNSGTDAILRSVNYGSTVMLEAVGVNSDVILSSIRRDINMTATQDINMTATQDINMTATQDINATSTGNIAITSGGTLQCQSATTTDISTLNGSITLNAVGVTADINLTGNRSVSITGTTGNVNITNTDTADSIVLNTRNLFLSDKASIEQPGIITDPVTLDAINGSIITADLAPLATNATTGFTWSNNRITLNSVILLNQHYQGTGIPVLRMSNLANGSVDINISNASGTAALSAPMTIYFLILQ